MSFPSDDLVSAGNSLVSNLQSSVSEKVSSGVSSLGSLGGLSTVLSGAGLGKVVGSGTNSRTDFERALGRPDPLIGNSWDVVLYYKGVKLDISDYIEEVVLPSVKVDNKPIFRQGQMISFAKTESIGTMSLKLYETADLLIYRFFRLWKNQVRDPQGNYGLPADYKGKLRLKPLDSNKSSTRVLEIRGIFPISLPSYTFNSGASDRIVPDVEFSCDELVPLTA